MKTKAEGEKVVSIQWSAIQGYWLLKDMAPQRHGCGPHQVCLVFWLEPGIMVEGLGSGALVWPG